MKLSTLILIYELLEDEKRNLKEDLRKATEALSGLPINSDSREKALCVRDEIINRMEEVSLAIDDLNWVRWSI